MSNTTDIQIATKGINGNIDHQIPESKPTKPPRKKSVSFHDDVTDIDAESVESPDNLQQNPNLQEDLENIFNVSEKINFFKNAFTGDSGTKEVDRSLAHQTSIPQARLAFVTGMVQGSPAGSNSRVQQGRDGSASGAKSDGRDDMEMKKRCCVMSIEVPPVVNGVATGKGEEMTTTLTYSKIFATQKKMIGERKNDVEAVVDTSSILEHKEELRELWEKRIMADENQSSSPSIIAETNSKPLPEEETEEKVAKSESESNTHHKMTNGFVKHADDTIPDDNANHIHESNMVKESRVTDADLENNNSADSLEEDNSEELAGEKTYTSSLEHTLVMTEVKEVTSETTVDEEVCITQEMVQVETEQITTIKSDDEQQAEIIEVTENQKSQDATATVVEEQIVAVEESIVEKDTAKESVEETTAEANVASMPPEKAEDDGEKIESLPEKVILDVKEDEDGDGFVRVEECLPKDDNVEEEVDLPGEHFEQIEEHEAPSADGFGEPHFPISPTGSTNSEKVSHPEIEEFVKSGGVKRIIPGVQKTEQPYNTCTTETKIAMEIREMREREEELRLMREQALPSPVPSPVPPKTPSIRSPSPSLKESSSPVQGPGYRVSSVFGHRGVSPSLSVDEEKRPLKAFNKESAVEKEIRLAKDREEELRKQKGLPPREDDSYVKPSQVKSSQVRVFGKVAGSNNNSVKQAATAKIQMEIEEQTQREMALRETGNIQTISQERTDSKVAKLKTVENPPPVQTNGNSHPPSNGYHMNGHSSPDSGAPYKRSSPSPTNVSRPASIFAQNNALNKGNISMHKFINSKGKEATFSAPRSGPFQTKEESIIRPAVPPTMVKLKRNVSVESKIQQEIMEMKQREEELKKIHLNMNNGNSVSEENGIEHEMNQKNTLALENGNGNSLNEEEISPRHNKLIAQWEQRIQKAES